MLNILRNRNRAITTKLGTMNSLTKLCAITAPLLIVSQLAAGPANAAPEPKTEPAPVTSTIDVIHADPTATLHFERDNVSLTPAPAVQDTAVAVQSTQPEQSSTIANPVTPTPATTPSTFNAPAQPAPQPQPDPQPQPEPVHPSVSGKGAIIVAAALAQLGRAQDCTALVSNSLAAAGINFHGWPADYIGLGHIVPASAAQPGDLIYYANGGTGVPHIAVYIGGGMAVHGGWNGSTVEYSAYIGSGPVFIHL
jgi:peptidoglycan DL-endopeptidase CwlO